MAKSQIANPKSQIEDCLTREILLGAIKEGLERRSVTYDEQLQGWIRSIEPDGFFGYSPFGLPITCAFLGGFLYHVEGDEHYARIAREHLVNYRQFTGYYPKDYHTTRPEYHQGLPPVPSMFALWQYVKSYQWIQESPCLADSDRRATESIVADSMPAFLHFPEWGAHNRTVLRALCLALAARAFPGNPEADDWDQMARIFACDSLKRWNIEDAMLYHGVWLHALIWYADTCQVPDFFDHPVTRYYFEYFKQLLAPSGALADFGDSDWQSSSALYMACFARAAREYRDPEMMFAAERIFETIRKGSSGIPASEATVSAYLWLDDRIPSQMPSSGSGDVLDELAGKKIVFRNGWDPGSTFLLLNYKPETDFGVTQRDYLKNTLSVHAEKAHHGHSDENAICLLMQNESVLLHDGGYREELPNGKYRADYYHNRIVFREEELRPDTSVLDALAYDGTHCPVETMKIDFQSFQEIEMSRTRVIDRRHAYRWDRGLVYLKDRGWFVMFDGIHFLENAGSREERTIGLSNLLFTREILGHGETHFDTRIDRLRDVEMPDHARLLICFPQARQGTFWIGSQPTRRYYQDEVVVHQSFSGPVRSGDDVAFITLLIPHGKGEDLGRFLGTIVLPEVDRCPQAVALEIEDAGQKITLGMKMNLESEILTENIRPRYNWGSGRTRYGDVQTDAHFFYCREQAGAMSYAFTEAVRLEYRNQEIFAAEPAAFPLQYAGEEMQVGIARWRAWEGAAPLE